MAKLRCIVLLLITLTAIVLAFPELRAASYCDPSKCKLPSCNCYGSSPNLTFNQLPQLIILSSDDALSQMSFENYIKPVLYGRKNPDGCPIGATFFVPHEYTNYTITHMLWAKGFEIGVNSITKNPLSAYWKNANLSTLIDEFAGQRTIISKFASIPKEDIRGARVPNLQLSGDKTYLALNASGLSYDSSWPTARFIWPYTLDYLSEQDCPVGPCPEVSIPKFWISPINMWKDLDGVNCNTVLGCQNVPTTEADILVWLKNTFHTVYDEHRTPFNIVMNSAVFIFNPDFLSAYIKFLDYLGSIKDVYFVNEWQAIQWMQNPKAKTEPFPVGACRKENTEPIKSLTCLLNKTETDFRYMAVCNTNCPKNYPWIGNPEGKSQ